MSGIGIHVVDLVALVFVERLGWRFMVGEMVVETGFMAVAWLCDSSLGIATVAFLRVVGPFMEPMTWASNPCLGLPNHRLVRPSLADSARSKPNTSIPAETFLVTTENGTFL
jgi:uncharacterized membrane protein YczE